MEIEIVPEIVSQDKSLGPVLTAAQTSPEEAATNISRANLFEVGPDQYKSLKTELDPRAETFERMPAQVQPETQNYLKRSEQHASLAKEDVSKLNTFESRFKYYKEATIDLPVLQRDANELAGKELVDGSLSEGDMEALKSINAQIETMSQSHAAIPDISDTEKFITEGVGAIVDMGRAYTENAGLTASILGGFTAGGAGLGALAGGVGAAPGAVAGFGKGFIVASTVVSGLDAYKQTRDSINNTLMFAKDATGKDLNVDPERRRMISQGVGVVSGVAGGIAGKVLAKANPFLKRFTSPKLAAKLLTESPALMAKMEVLGGVVKSVSAEGGEEALQEILQIVGEKFGKMDETEASFTNALTESLTDLQTWKQAGKAAALGGFAGGAISGATGAAGYKGLKERYTEVQQVSQKRTEVVTAAENMKALAKDVKDTKMNKVAPTEMNYFMKKVNASMGIDENVFFSVEDLGMFADNKEKGDLVRKLIDPDSELTKTSIRLGTPVPVNKADLIEAVMVYPDLADYMTLTPEGENALTAKGNAKGFIDRLEQADTKRAEILATLGVDGVITPELQAKLEELSKLAEDPNPYAGRNEYIESQTFDEMPGVMTKDEAIAFGSAHLDARLAVADAIKQEVDDEFETINNRIFRDVNEKDIAYDIKKLDTEFKILEKFNDRKVINAITVDHKKKGYSPMAIDPRSLDEAQREIYLGNVDNRVKMEKRKVFVEGGLSLDESAALNGVESGDELLRILAETPSRKEVQSLRAQREIQLRNRIEQTTKPAKISKREAAFTNLTRIHLKEAEYMRTKEYKTNNRGIIKIATPTPTVEALNLEAKETINKMTVKNIIPNKFKVGESKAQKAALQDFLGGRYEQAFENKGKAALNNEFRKESINALMKIKKYEKFWKSISTPSVQQTFKEAGMSDAINDFLAVYRLDGAVRGAAEKLSFQKFVKSQAELGDWTPVIPTRLDDVQQSYKDITLEQYQAITEAGEWLLKKAKYKNKVLGAAEARVELQTQERIENQIDIAAKAHFDYDENKTKVETDRNLSVMSTFYKSVRTLISAFASIKSTVSKLDEDKPNGLFNQLFGNPFKNARTNERLEVFDIVKNDKELIKKFYGMDKFKEMQNEWIDVPEFKDISSLGIDGEASIRKTDLLVLQAYMGDPDGRERMKNFKDSNGVEMTPEKMQSILDVHLDENDAAFVQAFLVDRWKRFEARSFALHERTTGQSPEAVKGVPIIHRGKVLPGGYYPLKSMMRTAAQRAADMQTDLEENSTLSDEGIQFAKLRSAEQTQQGRLKSRSGGDRPLDLNFTNFIEFSNEFAHDIHFRETGIEALKILKNPKNAANMQAIIGQQEFASFLNSVKDSISKTSERESTLFQEQNALFNGVISKLHSLHAVKTIGLNLGSAAIQPTSLANLVVRMGPKTPLYLAAQVGKVLSNITNFSGYVKQMSDINPDIKLEKDGIDNTMIKDSYDGLIVSDGAFLKKWLNTSGQSIAKIRDLQKQAINASFSLVRETDNFIKSIATGAISEQFLNGDIEGYSKERVDAMTEAERDKTLQAVVQQAIDLSLTASSPEDKTAFEKNKIVSIFARYFTDRRSRLNTSIAQINRIRGNFKRGQYGKAAANTIMIMTMAGVAQGLLNTIRGKGDDWEEELKKVKDFESASDFALDKAWDFATAPVSALLEDIPGVDAVKYAVGQEVRSDYRSVSTPIMGVLSDTAMGIIALKELLQMARAEARKALGMKKKGVTPTLSKPQRKALLTTAGYIVGGAPTNGAWKAYEAMDSKEMRKGGKILEENIRDLNKEISAFAKMFKDEPDAQPFINDLIEYKKTLPQFDEPVKDLIPENAKEDIKNILSGGDWTKVDNFTGAAGIYQFTEERWNEIATLNPDMGLTENGRVAKDPAQQEKAMNWQIQDNTRGLLASEVPVDTSTLLGAHKFGLDNYISIYNSKDNVKLSDILGDEAGIPDLEKFKTVREVKEYLKRQVNN